LSSVKGRSFQEEKRRGRSSQGVLAGKGVFRAQKPRSLKCPQSERKGKTNNRKSKPFGITKGKGLFPAKERVLTHSLRGEDILPKKRNVETT